MPTMPKERDCGWFYYAPPKANTKAAMVDVAPPSQIDCLTSIQRPEDEPPRMLFRDTDSTYIRMAKMGGREDLLVFKENTPNTGPAKDYPRSADWFYLEDAKLQDRMEQECHPQPEPYQFGQPDYMVHIPFNSHVDNTLCPRRCPYAESKNRGIDTTPATIPEIVKPGYGIRGNIPLDKKTFPPLVKDSIEMRKKKLSKQATDKDEPTNMNKLLSNDYEKEWHARQVRFQEKREKAQEMLNNNNSGLTPDSKQKIVSEYGSTYKKQLQSMRDVPSAGRRSIKSHDSEGCRSHTKISDVFGDKELFKLSKFKNVNSKVDSGNHINDVITSNTNASTEIKVAS